MKKHRAFFVALWALCLVTLMVSTHTLEAAPGNAAASKESNAETGVFDVTRAPYHAVPNDDKDDTSAIQRAIDDAMRAGGGTVFLRRPGVYRINGAFQTRNGANCQLRIPKVPLLNNRMISLTFEGPYQPPGSSGGPLLSPLGGAILHSTMRGQGKQPALLGCETPDAAEPSGTYVTIRNLTFRCAENPDIAAIHLANVGNANLENVSIDVQGAQLWKAVLPDQRPRNPNGIGIYLPRSNNLAVVGLRNIYIAGYGRGLIVGEHVSADQLILFSNAVAIEFAFGFHANYFGRVLAPYNEVVLDVTGSNAFFIEQLDLEDTGDGGVGNAALYLRDPGNLARGSLRYYTVVSWHGYSSRFHKVGGKYLRVEDLGQLGGARDEEPTNSAQWGASELQSGGNTLIERDWQALMRDVIYKNPGAPGDRWQTPPANLKAGSYAIQILCETIPGGAKPTARFVQGGKTFMTTAPDKLDTYSVAPKKNVWLTTGYVSLPAGQTHVELIADERNSASTGWQLKLQAIRIIWRHSKVPK